MRRLISYPVLINGPELISVFPQQHLTRNLNRKPRIPVSANSTFLLQFEHNKKYSATH